MTRRTDPLIARLLLHSHLEKTAAGPKRSHCWFWEGSVNNGGYGVIGLGVRGVGTALTHRVSYEFFIGPIPEGLTLDHLCENKRCVRPTHLEPVTQAENSRRKHIRDGHCRAGHEMTEANTVIRASGTIRCRACRDTYQTEYRNRKREAVAPD